MPLGESGSKTIPIVRLVKNRKRGLAAGVLELGMGVNVYRFVDR